MSAPRAIAPDVQLVRPGRRAEDVRLLEYVSAATLCDLLDLRSESTIYDRAKRGLLPKPYTMSGLTRWKWSEVVAMMEGAGTPEDEDDPILKASRGR
ncbi:helix-turn-helix transcriptional regulator [Sagittula sp. S175]|uniref:helix-turn-helix transcriptional regulator n=1 Tax=Sagittula sp. S175 TaxID=3415129 RepID=UPI003C7C2BD9